MCANSTASVDVSSRAARPRVALAVAMLALAVALAGCKTTTETDDPSPASSGGQVSGAPPPSTTQQAIAEGRDELERTEGVVATVIYVGRRRLPNGKIDSVQNIYTSDKASPFLPSKIRANEAYLRGGRVVPSVVKHLGEKEMGQLLELIRREGFFSIPPEDWTERSGMKRDDGETHAEGLRPVLPFDRAPALFILRDGKVTGLVKDDVRSDLPSLKKFAATERALIRASRWL